MCSPCTILDYMANKQEKQIIGRLEYVELLDFNLQKITARVDTGAYHSAIHAHEIQESLSPDGKKVLTFYILDEDHPEYSNQQYISLEFRTISIKSSNGATEKRYLIPVTLRLGNREITSEFSLTSRKDMKYPMLLGRLTLRDNFLVDVDHSFLMSK